MTIRNGPTLGTENIVTTKPDNKTGRADMSKTGNPLAGHGDSRISTHHKSMPAKASGSSGGGSRFGTQNPRGYSYMKGSSEGSVAKSANVAPDGTRRVRKG